MIARRYVFADPARVVEACARAVPGTEEEYPPGLACERVVGHDPPCMTGPMGAAEADGVYLCCHMPESGPHHERCRGLCWTEVKIGRDNDEGG